MKNAFDKFHEVYDILKIPVSDTRKVFFISDTHFFHEKLTSGCPRAFECHRYYTDVQEMNADIIRKWRDTVGDDDLVVFMGDFLFGTPCREQLRVYEELISQVPHKEFIWVKGNHDSVLLKQLHKAAPENRPAAVCNALIMKYQNRAYICQHRSYDEAPMVLSKQPLDPPVVLVHGHTHSTVRISSTGVSLYPIQNNVCWEVDYNPINAASLLSARSE